MPQTYRQRLANHVDSRTLDLDATSKFTVEGTAGHGRPAGEQHRQESAAKRRKGKGKEVKAWTGPIQQIAKLAGTTSRTLRHYDDIGLLKPSRIGDNGYRYYDQDALVRLQRILLLRELGLGLPAIAEVLGNERTPRRPWAGHLDVARQEQDRLARQIASVQHTIEALKGGERNHGREHVRRLRPHPVQGGGRGALGQGCLREERRLVAGMGADGEGGLEAALAAARQRLDRGRRGRHRARQRGGAGARAAPRRVAERHPGHAGGGARAGGGRGQRTSRST